jgi:menaquinone-dependent protoporphyrinogen oxidase
MKSVLVLYATREGHTLHIANHILQSLFLRGLPVEERSVAEIAEIEETVELDAYQAVILVASARRGHHEPEMVAFVRRHRSVLELLPCAFLSVRLSGADAEPSSATPPCRGLLVTDTKRMRSAFFEETGWYPARFAPVASALQYTRYGALVRWLMTRFAAPASAGTDTLLAQVFADWDGLDLFVSEFLQQQPLTHEDYAS